MRNQLLVVGSSGGTVTERNGEILISNGTAKFDLPPFSLSDVVVPRKKSVPVTEVLQVSTLTPTAANSTLFTVAIKATNEQTGVTQSWTFKHTTAASGGTATTICDAFRSQINAVAGQIPVTTSGTATLILTAATGYALFTVTASVNISISATTAGVTGIGQGTLINLFSWFKNMTYANVTGNVIADGSTYNVYDVVVNSRSGVGSSHVPNSLPIELVILVHASNTTFESALDTALGTPYES